MITYKYTDKTNNVVHVIDEEGISRSSMLAFLVPEGSFVESADPEPVFVPQEVSKAQGIFILSQMGLWQAVKDYFATEASEIERELFAAITSFNRQSPLLISLKDRFGLTDDLLDQMFIDGSKVLI